MARTSAARSGDRSGQGEREYFNPLREFCRRLPELVDKAQEVRLEADEQSIDAKKPANHRGFYVGCAALALEYVRGDMRSDSLVAAVNTMPTKGGPRVCAEKRVVDKIGKTNRDIDRSVLIPGLVLIGEPQTDRATDYQTGTLWPCGETCWPNIFTRRLPAKTLLLTLRPDKRRGQVQTVAELNTFYQALVDGQSPSEPPLFHHPRDYWETVVDRFDALIPRNHDIYTSPETEQAAADAARTAIQGSLSLV